MSMKAKYCGEERVGFHIGFRLVELMAVVEILGSLLPAAIGKARLEAFPEQLSATGYGLGFIC